jgi:crotonobetainyl-CoA:carnitine CoA-transferase CaiB-like acyl-CoA transferase
VRIVEFSNWFASPYGNRLLRDLGADVVKVEAVQGDPIRPLPDPCEGANGGKRDLALDLKDPAAAPVLRDLLSTADILQHNMRPGAAERLHVDAAAARDANPGIIYAYAPGYGSSGPKAKLQSFAPLLSGFVGLMHIAAGPGNVPHTCFGNEDYYNGLLSAVAQLLALVHRERTGEGQTVETPQLHSSILVTSEHVVVDGIVRSMLPVLDPTQSFWDVGLGLYQCLEGWICVACRTATELASFGAVVGALVSDAVVDEMYGRTATEWSDVLRAAGVPCEVVREDAWLRPFLCDEGALDAGLAVEIEHPIHGRARVIGELFHLQAHPARARRRAPMLGEQTVELLAELGVPVGSVDALADRGVVRVGADSVAVAESVS